MKTILQIIILCWFCILSVQAQWVQQNAAGGPVSNLQTINSQVAWCTSLTHTGVLRTTDGGVNWNATATTALFPTIFLSISLSAISADSAWYLAKGNSQSNGLVYRTTDGGITWVQQQIPLSTNPSSIYFFDSQNGVVISSTAGGKWDIYTTVNGGNTWTVVPLTNLPPGSNYGNLSQANSFSEVGNIIWFAGKSQNNMVVLKSTDRGYNWSSSTLSMPSTNQRYYPETIAFRDSLNGLLAMDSILFRTMDGGSSWQQVAYTGQMCSTTIISIPGTSTYLAVGSNTVSGSINRGSSYSTDNGNTWVLLDTDTHMGASFVSPTIGWVGGINYVYKYNGNPLLGISKQNEAALPFTIIPNPGSGLFSLTQTPNKPFTIELYNLAGARVLRQQGILSGINSLDLSGQLKGIYIVRIITPDKVTSQKLVKL